MESARTLVRRTAWTFLLISAIVYQLFNAWIGVGANDTENLESTLVYVAAGQFDRGPGSLYGPFSGTNPHVVIQAPLYYRLTWIAAKPLVALGVDRVAATLAAGRTLSYLSLIALLVIVARIAAGDGGSRLAAAWSVLMLAASAVISSFPVSVRPDTLGIALQTLGIALTIRGLNRTSRDFRNFIPSFIAFALAFCVKQHLVVGWGLSILILIYHYTRKNIDLKTLVVPIAAGSTIVLVYFAIEQATTRGMLIESIFVIPGLLGRVSAGSWRYVATVFGEIAKRSVGPIAIGAAAIPLLFGSNKRFRTTDRYLLVCLILEIAMTIALCKKSSGAWYNYAMQATVCGSILAARIVGSIEWSSISLVRPAALCLATLALLVSDVRIVVKAARNRFGEQAALRYLLNDPRVSALNRNERFFARLPQYNRMYGRDDAIVDDWLYSSYEAIHAVEPRSVWLKAKLTDGRVRLVVTPVMKSGEIPGLDEKLPELGYAHAARYGPYDVWERIGS
jgi:hypothetical protein